MKKLIIILAAILATIGGAKAQKSETSVAVAPTKMNIMYACVDNPLDIAVEGYKDEDLIVTISGEGNTITKSDSGRGHYIAKVIIPKNGYEATVTIFAKTKKGTIELGKRNFRVKRVPATIASVGLCNGGEIHKNQLMNNIVIAKFENFDFDVHVRVVHFTLTATVNDTVRHLESNSNLFTYEQKMLISELPSGSTLYIEDIITEDPDGYRRNINAIKYTIK